MAVSVLQRGTLRTLSAYCRIVWLMELIPYQIPILEPRGIPLCHERLDSHAGNTYVTENVIKLPFAFQETPAPQLAISPAKSQIDDQIMCASRVERSSQGYHNIQVFSSRMPKNPWQRLSSHPAPHSKHGVQAPVYFLLCAKTPSLNSRQRIMLRFTSCHTRT